MKTSTFLLAATLALTNVIIAADQQATVQKLKDIRIPIVDFSDSSLPEVLDFLRLRSRELDPEARMQEKGVNFVLHAAGDPMIKELSAEGLSLLTLLKSIARQTKTTLIIEDHAVILSDQAINTRPARDAKRPAELPLRDTRLPTVDFEECTLADAIDFIRFKSRELLPKASPLNFIIEGNHDAVIPKLRLRNASIYDTLRFICILTNSQFDITSEAVFIRANTDEGPQSATPKDWGDLAKITIPSVFFSQTAPADALEFINHQVKELAADNKTRILLGNGIPANTRVSMRLTDVALPTVLEHLARLCNAECQLEPGLVRIQAKGTEPTPTNPQTAPRGDRQDENPFLKSN